MWMLLITLIAASPASAQETEQARRPNANDVLDSTPWSVMAFKGWSNYHTLGRTVRFIWDYAGEDVYGADVTYTISPTTGFGRFFDRNFSPPAFRSAGRSTPGPSRAASGFRRLSAYFALRWRRLPWNHIVATSFSMGEGLSIVSDVPDVEILTTEVGGTSRLLNYLMMEMTLAVPSLPYLQLVGRIHHRSGCVRVCSAMPRNRVRTPSGSESAGTSEFRPDEPVLRPANDEFSPASRVSRTKDHANTEDR